MADADDAVSFINLPNGWAKFCHARVCLQKHFGANANRNCDCEHNRIRDGLASLAPLYYNRAVAAFKGLDLNGFVVSANSFISLLSDLEKILATQKHFLLGTWIEDARRISDDGEAPH